MNHRSRLPAILLAGIVALGESHPALHAASAGKSFPAAVRRNLDEEGRLIVNLLQNYHYSGRGFGDVTNIEMIDRFLKELDSDQVILSQADFDFMHRRFGHTLKTVYIYKGDMQPAQEIYGMFVERMTKRLEWIDKRLTEPFDLTTDRIMTPGDLEPSTNATTEENRWETRLTNELITAILAGRTEQAARDYLAAHYRKIAGYGAGYDPYEIRAMFLDGVIRSFDSHSGYFSADSSKEFALEMAGTVTGVGIQVRKDSGRCIVDSIDPGGPADLGSDLQPGDELFAIANEGEDPSDITQMRLREVTDRLRGTAGTSVTLEYRHYGADADSTVTITRSVVTLLENRAFGSVYLKPDAGGTVRRIGAIAFPTFYASEGENASSVSADVAELLKAMTAGGIDGLVIDLRDNPGGSMEEAVRLCGMFLHSGPAAYSRAQSGEITPYPIKAAESVYDGPMIVLTNSSSASASELFSGAMKAHQRALIVGDKATFGKGSVQNYIALDKLGQTDPQKNWGTLRLTSAMFNLPNGGAIQQNGVPSDVVLPAEHSDDSKREVDLEHSLNPLPLDVAPLEPQPGGALLPAGGDLIESLSTDAKNDIESLPEWQLWRDEEAIYEASQGSEPQSLSIAKRRAARDDSNKKSQELIARRRDLVAKEQWPIETIDLASTTEAMAAHDKRLRGLLGDRKPDPLIHLDDGSFVVETTQGHLMRLRWKSFPFARLTGSAGELADAFNAGAGTALTREDFGVIIEELLLVEYPGDAAAREVFARHVPGDLPPANLRAGIDAMLARVVELHPNLRAERWVFDIPLREAVRAASDWAARRSGMP